MLEIASLKSEWLYKSLLVIKGLELQLYDFQQLIWRSNKIIDWLSSSLRIS